MSDAVCRECSGRGRLVHSGLRDRHFGVEGEWRILACPDCERFWLDPPPADGGEVARLYDDYYTHASDAGDERSEAAAVAAPRGFEPWLKRAIPIVRLGYPGPIGSFGRFVAGLLARVRPLRTIGERAVFWLEPLEGGRLLDVGCGAGELLVRMRDLGWECHGVELDTQAARVARAASGSLVFEQLERVEAGAYDVVVLDHVLEHLADPASTLAGCRRALRPGGRLVLATPNPMSAARERFGASWLHWDPPRHLEMRGERAMRRTLERAGFEIDELSSCAGSAHFVWAASREIEIAGSLPGIRLTRSLLAERGAALRFWFAEHRRVAAGEACGEEWIALARRPASAASGGKDGTTGDGGDA